MSVLGHDEDAAALAEALAFVDEFSLPPVDLGLAPWTPLDAGHDVTSQVRPTKKRVRDPAADVRRRQRRKQEREALRQQVKDLERQLIKARRAFQPTSGVSGSTDGDESARSVTKRVTKRTALRWHKALVEEQRRRNVAESLNALLKNALAAQVKTSQALQQCLKQFGPASVPAVTPAVDLPAPSPVLGTLALSKAVGELQAIAMQLYREANASWDVSLARSVLRDYNIRSDPKVGTYCETRTAAPLGQSLTDTAALIRLAFLWNKFPMPSESLEPGKVTALAKQLVMDLTVHGKQIRFHCVFVFHWSYEADRVVVTYSSLLFHPSGAFCFREGSWMIVQQSYDNISECLYQSRTHLAAQMFGDGVSAHGDETNQAQSIGMTALSSKAQIKSEKIQHRLLVETGRDDLARMLPAPRPTDAVSCSSETMQRTIRVFDAP